MDLLQRIQEATVDPTYRLTDILRLCKILSSRLDHSGFKDWIANELDGYSEVAFLPDYRKLENLSCHGHLFGAFGREVRNVPIATLSLPEEWRKPVSTKHVRINISSLERTVDEAASSQETVLQAPWDANLLVLLRRENPFDPMVLGQAWTDISVASFVAILDTVKNKILDFVLELDDKLPRSESGEIDGRSIPSQTVTNVFQHYILNHGQVAVSNSNEQTYKTGIEMTENYVNNLQGANVANMANTLNGNARQQANQHVYTSEEQKTLAEAADEIQMLLRQLESDSPTVTESEKIAYLNDETSAGFKRRVISALQASGESAMDEFILENKYLKVAKAAVKGWIQPGN
ncbi:MAG: hypothetical protein AAFQ63_18135 [Cyanobacteria bacterium J06621_11]